MPDANKKYFYISSLEKGIRVLELLADKQELTVTKVAEHLGLNRAGSHRFLATLRELGYVEQNVYSSYRLTFKILELGMKLAGRFEIRRVARPFMQELHSIFNETVNLGYWDGTLVVHLDKIETEELLKIDLTIGSRAPVYCTGLGKSILAFLPEEEREAVLERVKLVRFTENTITRRAKLNEEFAKIRKRGVAFDREEVVVGLRCVAAPVFDYTGLPRYAMSIAGPATRMTDDVMRRMQKEVKRICLSLSKNLGGLGEA